MYQKKRKYEIFAIACILGMVMYIAGNKWSSQAQAADYQKHMAQEILRFHVIANSDSEEDQTLKMKVKEGVVSYVSTLTQVGDDLESTKYIISLYMEEIKKEAQRIIEQEGYSYEVEVELTESYFPVKSYGEAVFPAGVYQALKIEIGKAEGKNWWCVLYPNLCFVDSAYGVLEEDQKEMLKEVLTEEEYESIFQADSEDIKISFKLFSGKE
ncbi:MAG: stage II sporulation protein R [Lachnospiraceae bacterium]|nr:stage II sporulation protein R [Lachnospiraceae bacterium]